jgi:hypothetical protein
MTDATIGYGIVFSIHNGTTFVPVAEVTDANPPQYTRDEIDATNHGSPDGYREYIFGLKDGGSVNLELNYVPSVTDPILAAFEAGKGQFKIVIDDVQCVFFAGVTSYQPQTPLAEKKVATATFKVTGKPVWSAVV